MSFSIEWDENYRDNKHLTLWPMSALIKYVMRYAKPKGHGFRVLELGCGPGGNIPFFKSLGVKYYSVEGSPFIVDKIKERFPDLGKNIACGDFTESLPFNGYFDVIVDRASLTHNTTAAITRCLDNVYKKLKPGGRFIGIDWFSRTHSDSKIGDSLEGDRYSKTNIKKGHLSGVGVVHFSDKQHLLRLFKRFHMEVMEHKMTITELPGKGHVFAAWDFVAVKGHARTRKSRA